MLEFIDLTTLTGNETPQNIDELLKKAKLKQQLIAGICVYPQWAPLVKKTLEGTHIKTVTVLNFPHGSGDINKIAVENKEMLNYVDEVDIVIDWKLYNQLASGIYEDVLDARKHPLLKSKTIKIILETGMLNPDIIYSAALSAINGGANFLKTSTGKVNVGATTQAVEQLCKAIKDTKKKIGIKISGGVKTSEQAKTYIAIVTNILGKEWLTPETFRIGIGPTSDLLEDWK